MQSRQDDAGRGRRGGNGLEDRLRGLILTNSGADVEQPNVEQHSLPRLSQFIFRPPENPPAGSAGNLATGQVQNYAEDAVSDQNPISPKASRRRPNQAQRRQMSAQLSIPIDNRPAPPHSARPYVSPPGHHAQHHSSSFHGQQAQPQSSAFYNGSGPPSAGHWSASPSYAQQRYQAPPAHYAPSDLESPRYHYPPASSSHAQHQPNVISPRMPRNHQGSLYNHRGPHQPGPEEVAGQASFLEGLCNTIVANAAIGRVEIAEKEAFRLKIQQVCQVAVTEYERQQNGAGQFASDSVQLKCFGSLSSGFATKASDMDLGLLSPFSVPQPDASGSPIPRLIERAFLDLGLGARLLTRTRVPIIKLCEKPPESLRRELVLERERWEKGIDPDDVDGANDEDHIEGDSHHDRETTEEPEVDLAEKGSDNPLAGLASDEPKKLFLRQSEKQSLHTYYNAAKRVLRKLGGRDITAANLLDFSEEDFKLLNKVCEAFIRGLYDSELKDRLLKYTSLSFQTQPNIPNHRSLVGVFTQVEGEKLVMIWENRKVTESSDHDEKSSLTYISAWQNLQNYPNFGGAPTTYTKQLQQHNEKMRRIPSIQLVLLEQGQYEAVGPYHSRALKIMSDLMPRQPSASLPGRPPQTPIDSDVPASLYQAVIYQYVCGIWDHSSRAAVQEFVNSCQETPSFLAIARRHKSMQLAVELERALDRGLYSSSLVDDIKRYIGILRGPLRRSNTGDEHYDYVIPVTPENMAIIKKMRDVSDPAKLSPNQPRDPYRDRLEFPKDGVGVQCDINFSAHLALQNTLLLRCYAHTDPRVRPLVLFVKHWAKVRGINTPYRGTLSSYGYVLMMLHYLVNVAQPFVCPNLQQLAPPIPHGEGSPAASDETVICKGTYVGFWRDEQEILRLASNNQLNYNADSVGHLLRGFFEYYAQTGMMATVPCRGYDWGRDILSIRTPGGLLSKAEKGWTGAKTVKEYHHAALPSPLVDSGTSQALPRPPADSKPNRGQLDEVTSPTNVTNPPQSGGNAAKGSEVKEVRHRYLFAIEDPFELDHNVARTVTHNGIVAIRDEFRRAWRIIRNVGSGNPAEELLQNANAVKEGDKGPYLELLDEIHGWELFG